MNISIRQKYRPGAIFDNVKYIMNVGNNWSARGLLFTEQIPIHGSAVSH